MKELGKKRRARQSHPCSGTTRSVQLLQRAEKPLTTESSKSPHSDTSQSSSSFAEAFCWKELLSDSPWRRTSLIRRNYNEKVARHYYG